MSFPFAETADTSGKQKQNTFVAVPLGLFLELSIGSTECARNQGISENQNLRNFKEVFELIGLKSGHFKGNS